MVSQAVGDDGAVRADQGASAPVALRVSGLSKTFGSTRALDDVNFEVRRGRIHALVGGNGSGKSTTIKILAGVYKSDPGHGTIAIEGDPRPADQAAPELSRSAGMRFVHQNPAVFPELTVAENLAIGAGFVQRGPSINWKATKARTRQMMERFAIPGTPATQVKDLRPAEQTMVAIARALQDIDKDSHSILVLDEPTASLPPHEVGVLLDALRAMARAGQTILFVSHRIDEVLDLTEDVTVFRDGRHIITRATAGLTEAKLVEYIVGRDLEQMYPATNAPSNLDTTLVIQNLAGGPLTDVSFSVGAGEIVGIAGLLGSGRTELLKMIFGAYPKSRGEIFLKGKKVELASPGQGMAQGIGFVPEDRAMDALFAEQSVRQNIGIGVLRKFWNGLWLRRDLERRTAVEMIKRFDIRTAGDTALISSLSGGNQQKAVVARWLLRKPMLLLLDDPTQGVDVEARKQIHEAVRAQAVQGLAVLLVSSDMEELAQASDRVLVLRNGRIAAEASGSELTSERLTHLVYLAEGTP